MYWKDIIHALRFQNCNVHQEILHCLISIENNVKEENKVICIHIYLLYFKQSAKERMIHEKMRRISLFYRYWDDISFIRCVLLGLLIGMLGTKLQGAALKINRHPYLILNKQLLVFRYP